MLTWRPILRPASIARRAINLPRRPLQTSILPGSHPVTQPRPSGLLGKVRFRADGQPRSKWMGAFVGTLILSNILTLLSFADFVEGSDLTFGTLAGIVYMHKVDLEYDTINFDDPEETYVYFKRIYYALSHLTEAQAEPLLKHFTRIVYSSDPSEAELRARLHEITRQVGEEVHLSLRELDSGSMAELANHILLVMKDGLEQMLDLIQDIDDDDDEDGGAKHTFQLIKMRETKDSGTDDYEVLG